MFQTKNIELEIKDIDSVSRRVRVALSKFGNVDSDGDVILMGAFAKSIQERGPESTGNRKIAALRYHDFEHEIGVWKKLEETHDFLIGELQLGRATKGNDALFDYEDGVIREHSIGFNLIPDKITVREDGIKEIRELILWEGGPVTFGANSEAATLHVGKGNKTEYLDKLNKKMNCLIGALKNGKGTDERLMQIEMDLRVCQTKYNSLIIVEPIISLDEEEPNAKQLLTLTKFI